MKILLHLISAALYALLAVHFWRALRAASPMTPQRGLTAGERIALAVPLGLHGAALFGELSAPGGLRFGFAIAVSLTMWLAVLLYWFESFWSRLEGLRTLALPLAAVAVMLPAVFPTEHVVRTDSMLFRAHFLAAMLAYSLATLAALHALLMAVVERRLHAGRFSRFLASLPPLLTMEALLFRVIGVAFALLTLAVGSGVVFSEEVFGRPLRLDHKTVFAIISWAIFGTLLLGRWRRGWRGRVALRWTLAGFFALLLAYVGTRFVLEVILGRG